MRERFLIFGHRGSPKRFPENTMASFEEALRAGADGFETDLRLLSDKTAVLYHDDELADIDFETLTYPECSARGVTVERLAELSRFAGTARMILEVKRGNWEEALVAEVGAWADVVVASFDHTLIAGLRRRGVAFPLGVTFHGYLLDVGAYAERAGATWCFPSHHYVDAAMVESLHARNIRVVPWTANRRSDWERLHDLGCDGVITDFPAEAVEWRAALPVRP